MTSDHSLDSFQQLLGYRFHDPDLLALALTHPSYAFETGRTRRDNQRLEFLGDAVLQLILTDHLYRTDHTMAEGEMTKLRAALVNRSALVAHARRFRLGEFLRIGRGEERNGGRDRDSNLADAFEAVIGAVYLDGGLPSVQTWLNPIIREALASEMFQGRGTNPKGLLQELLQARQLGSPRYEVLSATGPDHQREYRVAVLSADQILGEGTGTNKKAAEVAAALEALKKLGEKAH